MIKRKTVLLLKSQNSDGSSDKYEHILTSNGFEVKKVKTLVFDFKNIDILKQKLSNKDSYEGIIFSSPRCVQATCLAVDKNTEIIEPWREKYNFTVGEATYTEALNKLGLECDGKESGNAVNLSKVIIGRKSAYQKPLLFPHGNLKTDTLNLELGKEGIEIEGVLVYDTIANPNILKEISDVTDDLTTIPEYVVFFSPSGFHCSIDHLRKIPIELNIIKFVAIGPVTELAIKEDNCKVYGVIKQPTPKDLLDLLLKD